MFKSQFIARLTHSRDEWELLINHVGFSRVAIGGVSGNWSVKNIVAHIMVHEHYLADRLAEIARGEEFRPCETQDALDSFIEEFGYPDLESPLVSLDSANEWMYHKYKNVGMKELIADELHAFESVLAQVRALSEEQLDKPGLIKRIKTGTIDHYRHHGVDIKKRFKRSILRSS
jgi:hypothetical protein